MCTPYTDSSCVSCANSVPTEPKGFQVSLLGNLLLIVLPKCSFCVLAYTSTMLLCTRDETIVASSVHASSLTIGITATLCLLILGGILFNRKGTRSFYALILALTGISLMLTSAGSGGGEALYYAGNLLVFLGIWVNGGLSFLMKKKHGLSNV